ncbi:MAG: ergothioneine biosynthesis protein EgtB [Nanoarchaeota archaeon]|nr:ergothioneine biosynthesis protein EgtB [Nanoarchaeota archaeon]
MMTSNEELIKWVKEARQESIDLVSDLNEDQLTVPYLDTVNPLIWEICHLTYFQELWVLRKGVGQKPIFSNADSLFDSIKIGHEARWKLPIPNKEEAFDYLQKVRDRVLELINSGKLNEQLKYYIIYSVFHEDMHTESLTYTRQTLGYSVPKFSHIKNINVPKVNNNISVEEDVLIPNRKFMLGATKDTNFVFDNERWAHEVKVEPFKISRTAVTEGQFAKFVDDKGYQRKELWDNEGWKWKNATQAEHPLYWRKENDLWQKRYFDKYIPIDANRAVIHVSWYEADAYCRWAKRRLPTETEWEVAASIEPEGNSLSNNKRNYPWGNEIPNTDKANLGWQSMGTVDIRSHEKGDSTFGCRQMIGNVWEWTDTTFKPYPGFVADMYQDYSQTSFDTRKVLKGGCWATQPRLISNTWRNFYTPDRRDVFAGFRTCELKA